jgi:hypothetical protein
MSWVLSQCDPVANGIDLSLLERVSPMEWDNVVLYGQYILTGSSSAGAGAQKGPLLAHKITRICPEYTSTLVWSNSLVTSKRSNAVRCAIGERPHRFWRSHKHQQDLVDTGAVLRWQ